MGFPKTVGRVLAFTIVTGWVLGGCAPQVEPMRELTAPPKTTSAAPQSTETELSSVDEVLEPTVVDKVSRCVSPPVASSSGVDAAFEAERLNADTMARIAVLEYLLAEIDPEYSCGTVFQRARANTVRSIRVYKMDEGAQTYASLAGALQSALQDVSLLSKSKIVILADFSGLLPNILTKTGWVSDEVGAPRSPTTTQRALYTRLADSNQSIFISFGSTKKPLQDIYNCSDFSSRAAAQTFFNGLSDDVNRLDADNDGLACEVLDNTSRQYQVTLAEVPTAAPVVAATPSSVPTHRAPTRSSGSSGGRCYVSGYTRKNGTRVSGYYRRC